MKINSNILSFVIAIIICSVTCMTLNDCYEGLNSSLDEITEKSYFYDTLRSADRNCVKNKLQLPQPELPKKAEREIDEDTCRLITNVGFWMSMNL